MEKMVAYIDMPVSAIQPATITQIFPKQLVVSVILNNCRGNIVV